MSISNDSQQLDSYVPVYDYVPEKWEDARTMLVEVLKQITISLNAKEIGFYLDQILLSGKQFIPSTEVNPIMSAQTPPQYRQIFRVVVDMGSLAGLPGTISVPHGIQIAPKVTIPPTPLPSTFTLINVFGAATDPNGLTSIPLPFVSWQSIAQQIQVDLDQTNVNIRSQTAYPTYTRAFIIIEYMQEI